MGQFGDPRTIEILEEDPNLVCSFCSRSEVNAAEWGSLLKLDNIVTHHFCLLFSANASQNGKDDEGIQAFLPVDIKAELRRGKRLKCRFCKKTNATIGCSLGQCSYSYHYPCGYENGCLYQFFGQFRSFCFRHRKKQKIPDGVCTECAICFVDTEEDEAVWPPCCGKQLFHRRCMLETAKAAGYFFKCPLCNSNKSTFIQAMKENGVYVPEQDAAWETEPNAFQDLMEHYSKCDAEPCLCPQGREFTQSGSKSWALVRCNVCAHSATHMECSNINTQGWNCQDCVLVSVSRIEEKISDDESDPSSISDSSDETSPEEKILEKLPDISNGMRLEKASDSAKTPKRRYVFSIPGIQKADIVQEEERKVVEKCNESSKMEVKDSIDDCVEGMKQCLTPSWQNKLLDPTPVTESKRSSSVKEVFAKSDIASSSVKDSNVYQCSSRMRNRIRNPTPSGFNFKERLDQLRRSSIQGHDRGQSEEEKVAEKKRFEELQASMKSRSIERKAQRAKERERASSSAPHTNIGPSPSDLRKLGRIPRISNENHAFNTFNLQESGVDIGREAESEPKHLQPRNNNFINCQVLPLPPNTPVPLSAQKHQDDGHANGNIGEPNRNIAITYAVKPGFDFDVTDVQTRLLRLASEEAPLHKINSTASVSPQQKWYGDGFKTKYTERKKSLEASRKNKTTPMPTVTEVVNLESETQIEDGNDEVVEITDTNPDVIVEKIVRPKNSVPRSALLKRMEVEMIRRKRGSPSRSTFPGRNHYHSEAIASSLRKHQSFPGVVCLSDDSEEEIHPLPQESDIVNEKWNPLCSYNVAQNSQFCNIPHDYWLNTQALHQVRFSTSDSISSSTLSNSLISQVDKQRSSDQFYVGGSSNLPLPNHKRKRFS